MDVLVVIHPSFANVVHVREALLLVNESQNSFRLLLTERDWVSEVSEVAQSIDPNEVHRTKKTELRGKPAILITQRYLRGGLFSDYKRGFYLVSTAAWESAFPDKPVRLYIAYLISGILSYFAVNISVKESDRQTERHEIETIGCINDYCNTVDEILQSMLKAHICSECEDDLRKFGAQPDHLDSVKQTLALLKTLATNLFRGPLKVFISYKWEDKDHNEWVERFASDLRSAGIDAKLDRWEVRFGDSFTDYMTSKIAEADVFLFIMTTGSVAAAEAPTGQGGALKFEVQMATSRRIAGESIRVIGIYREGHNTAAHLRDHKYADFRNDSEYTARLRELVDDLLEKVKRPPLGSPRLNTSEHHSQRIVRLLKEKKVDISTEEIAAILELNKIPVLDALQALLQAGVIEKADTMGGGAWRAARIQPDANKFRLLAEKRIVDKWVSFDYPESAGIKRDLDQVGYDVAWSIANKESKRVDLEGWEHVLVSQPDGTWARLKVSDHSAPGGYLVFLKKRRT